MYGVLIIYLTSVKFGNPWPNNFDYISSNIIVLLILELRFLISYHLLNFFIKI